MLRKPRLQEQFHAYIWIGFWLALSVSIILVNKHVLYYSNFHYPCTLAMWHMFMAAVTTRAATWVLGMPDAIAEQKSGKLYGHIALTGLLFGGTLVTGNAALLYLSVTTTQMLKAACPVIMYIVAIAMRNEVPTVAQTCKVLIICAGVAMAGYGDVTFSMLGVALQMASIITDSIRCCLLQRIMQANHIKVGPLVTLSHVAPFTMLALLVPVAFYEGPSLMYEYSKWKSGIPMVVVSGLVAVALNFAVFKVIGLTSALTSSVTGVFKDWVCIIMAMYLFHTSVSGMQWAGYGVAVAALLWYHYSRIASIQAQETADSKTPGDAEAPLVETKSSRASP